LGIKLIIGLHVEIKEIIEETVMFTCKLSPHTIQVLIAAPYPGTALYAQAKANGWFADDTLVANSGIQTSTLRYPDLSSEDIENAVEQMYRRFYFRPQAIVLIVKEMLGDPQMLRRRLREGVSFSLT
jgi:radical SAM superfamily enzyme YgiQ (UPF0313 family)